MALTAANKADIRYFLGWSARFHQSDSRLEQAMSALDTELEAQALVLADIVKAKDIDTRLTDAYLRLKAIKLGSIDLPVRNEIDLLRSEGRRFVGRIAATLGVEVRHDVFAGRGPKSFASASGPVQGEWSGNYGRQG